MRYLTSLAGAAALAVAALAVPASAADRPAPSPRATVLTGATSTARPGAAPSLPAELLRGLDRASAARVADFARSRHRAGLPMRARTSAEDSGELVVTARDPKTGNLIEGLCVAVVSLDRKEACDKGTTVRISRLPTQTRLLVMVEANPHRYYLGAADLITLEGGSPTAREFALGTGGLVSTKVVDRSTGKGVGDTSVDLRGADHPDTGYAISRSNGVAVSTPMPPGRYRMLVSPGVRTGLGAQWVGEKAGTGREHLAAVVTVEEGKTTEAPKVRLDEGGALEGKIIDADGLPAPELFFSVESSRHFDIVSTGYLTDIRGDYQLPNLGPYEWSLRMMGSGTTAPEQWAGGEVRGDRAHTVKVRPGTATEWNVRLARGTKLTGAVNATGSAERGIGFYDATTGEAAGTVLNGAADTTYEAYVMGGGRYKAYHITVADDGASVTDGWHDSAATFAAATPVPVPYADAATADLRFPVARR
ncbi:MAG TPA: hypothetical protein VFY17_04075 [Pilimelia sp.]|nr:hypothetical protein [Pilimelia sp.]